MFSKSKIALMALPALLIATILSVAAPTPASADKACGGGSLGNLVADEGGVHNFHEACHRHDDCYDKRPYGFDSLGRNYCDTEMYQNMKNWCNNRWDDKWKPHHNKNRHACREDARVARDGVRTLGSKHFYNNGSLRGGPNQPTGVRARKYSAGTGELLWNRATDTNGGIVVGYRIWENGRDLGVLDRLSIYKNQPGTYRYRIVSIDNHGRGSRPVNITLKI